MADKVYTLTAPGGNFTINVADEDRANVFIGRGYVLVGQPANPGPKEQREVAEKKATAKKAGA